jgi:hypothetical protein
MSGSERRAKLVRRAGIVAVFGVIASAAAALGASAWQGQEWNTNMRWSDGREVHWRATPALGCDGSNVELRLVNNSGTSGEANLKDITFSCKRPSTYVAPPRSLGTVAPGGTYSAPVLNCACPEKGGVKELLSVSIDFVRNGDGAETFANGCSYRGAFASGQINGRGVYTCPDGYRYEGNYTSGVINGQARKRLRAVKSTKAPSATANARAWAA